MPTHALLGATGGTGSAILRYLLEQPPTDLQLNIFVRSEAKLLKLFPNLKTTSSPKVHVFSGVLVKGEALASCLRDAEVIYNCIATNTISPSNHLDRDTATKIIETLATLREEDATKYHAPTLLYNRTIALNPKIPNPIPTFLEPIGLWALDWAFDDKRAACELYATAAGAGLVEYVLVDAPGLLDLHGMKRDGHVLVTEGRVESCIRYADLGAGWVEVARKREEFVGGVVAVGSATALREGAWGFLGGLGLFIRGIIGKLLGI